MSIFGKARRLRAVLRDAHTAPADAMFIGDQGTDRDAAHAVGMAFGAVHWGYANIEVLRGRGCTHEFAAPRDLHRLA
jgi:phosphoglycolate phosphatase